MNHIIVLLRLIFARLVSGDRLIAANHAAPDRDRAYFVAENVAPIEDGNEWLQIAPYGEFAHPLGKQVVHRAHAEKMVAAFNSLSGRLARAFRGLPVFVGHPDVDAENFPDDRRRGKITALEARDDGLYGKVAWNKLGQENLTEGYHVYPSPAWLFPKNSNRLIEPDELLSVGLTNTPQIRAVKPWTNSEQQNKTATNTMPPWLLTLLGLPADATEEQAKSAATSKLNAAANMADMETKKKEAETAASNAKARVTELEGKLTAANSATKAAQDAHMKLLLDTATNDGRITTAERATHETAFNSDFTAAANALAALKPKLNTSGIEIGGTRVAINTRQERQCIITEAVEKHMADHKVDYQVAFNAVAKDPKYKAVFDAMDKPQHQQEATK